MSDIASILGFEPHQFTSELSNAIDKDLVFHVDKFKQDLKELIASKRVKDINESEIDKAADKLLEKIKQPFHRNMEKFDIYCSRNIFVPSSSSQLSKTETDDAVSSELEQLRQKYLSLRSQYVDLSASTKAASLFLADMRSSLFQIRVGAQVLDEYNIQPLAETMATLTQQKIALQELCVRAQEITDKMESSLGTNSDEKSSSDPQATATGNEKIVTKGDISVVTRSLKGK